MKFGGIAILILVVCFTSCQKEIDWNLISKPQNDSTILAKYIEIDSTLPAGLDTIAMQTFDYDNSGRLIRENIVSKDQNAPPSANFPFFNRISYLYNSNDTLPYKVIISGHDAMQDNYDTVYLFYTNGMVARDSIRSRYVDPLNFSFESISVNIYVDNGNNTQATQYRAGTLNPSAWPPPCPGTTNYQKTYGNGNITREIGNYTDCSGTGISEGNLVLDNHPNPIYPYRIPYPVLDGFLELGAIQKNNPVESWTFTGQDWYKFSYSYRLDGYPMLMRAYEVADPTNAWKGVYIYK